MVDQMLMNQLRFDESELQLNKKGQLSEKQRQHLQIKESGAKAGSLFLGGIFMLASFAGVGLGAYAFMVDYGLVFRIHMVSVFGCFWTLIWGTAGVMTLSRAFSKMEVKVGKAEGPVNIVKVVRQEYNPSTETHSEHSVHELLIGGRAFEVRATLPQVMKQGDVYAVYFAEFNLKEKKKEVLSAEWLAPASAATTAENAIHDDIEVVEFVKRVMYWEPSALTGNCTAQIMKTRVRQYWIFKQDIESKVLSTHEKKRKYRYRRYGFVHLRMFARWVLLDAFVSDLWN